MSRSISALALCCLALSMTMGVGASSPPRVPGDGAARALFTCPPTNMPGGLRCRAPDAAAASAANFAVRQLNARNAIANGPVTLGAITQYATQVVAGTNTFLTLTLRNAGGAPVNAQVRVFTPLPGQGAMQLADYVVLPATQGATAGPVAAPVAPAAPAAAKPAPLMKQRWACGPPGLAGGLSCQSTLDDQARAAANFAVAQLNAQNALPSGPVTLVSVPRFATQVVAGLNYFFDLKVKDATGKVSTVQAEVYWKLPGMGGGFELTGYLPL